MHLVDILMTSYGIYHSNLIHIYLFYGHYYLQRLVCSQVMGVYHHRLRNHPPEEHLYTLELLHE